MDEFYVTAFSNADTLIYPNNTLTRFENNLPLTYNFKKEDNWHVCIQNVGFSTDFKNIYIKNKHHFPGVHIFSENLNKSINANEYFVGKPSKISLEICTEINNKKVYKVIGNLRDEAYFYFADESMSIDKICIVINKHVSDKKSLLLDFVVQEGEPFKIVPTFIDNEVDLKYWILIHENLQETFNISLNYGGRDGNATTVTFEDEKYFVYVIEKECDIITGVNCQWQNMYPEYVRIKCDEITEQIFNGQLSKDLTILKPNFNKEEKYYTCEFENENYLPLANTTLNKISLSITDKNDKCLNLNRGIASFVKLKFKKMLSENFFHVRAESKDNTPNKFNFDIPRGLYLDSNWRVALTSVNFRNDFKPLPYEEELRTIFCGKISKDGKILSMDKYVLPNINYKSVEEIGAKINSFIGDQIQSRVDFTCSESDVTKTCVTFHLSDGVILIFRGEIGEILGYEFENKKNIFHLNNFVTLATLPKTDSEALTRLVTVKFEGFVNFKVLKPEYLMIYSDLIEPNIVGSSFANLLKIVPLSNVDIYKNEEFKHKEFHPLSSTLIKNINVSIRSHSGNLINFADKTKFFLNLLFVQK